MRCNALPTTKQAPWGLLPSKKVRFLTHPQCGEIPYGNLIQAAHRDIDTTRGIYNADFTVDVLPQAALRLHAVNYTQPLQGCITICFLSILIPNSR